MTAPSKDVTLQSLVVPATLTAVTGAAGGRRQVAWAVAVAWLDRAAAPAGAAAGTASATATSAATAALAARAGMETWGNVLGTAPER
jgi:hypothetical protein